MNRTQLRNTHWLTGTVLLAMLVLMLLPGAVVYEEWSADGQGLNYIKGSFLSPGVNLYMRGLPALAFLAAALWAAGTLRHAEEPKLLRLAPGGLCLLFGVLMLAGTRAGVPDIVCGLAAVAAFAQAAALALQVVSTLRGRGRA